MYRKRYQDRRIVSDTNKMNEESGETKMNYLEVLHHARRTTVALASRSHRARIALSHSLNSLSSLNSFKAPQCLPPLRRRSPRRPHLHRRHF